MRPPILLRQIGDHKWQDGEEIIRTMLEQGEQGTISIIVETYYGQKSGLYWKFVVKHNSVDKTLLRQTWSKDSTTFDDSWKLRYVYTPYV